MNDELDHRLSPVVTRHNVRTRVSAAVLSL